MSNVCFTPSCSEWRYRDRVGGGAVQSRDVRLAPRLWASRGSGARRHLRTAVAHARQEHQWPRAQNVQGNQIA